MPNEAAPIPYPTRSSKPPLKRRFRAFCRNGVFVCPTAGMMTTVGQ
nr:MAG TPA: hypothetical protein [Caudoviricetes sp.]